MITRRRLLAFAPLPLALLAGAAPAIVHAYDPLPPGPLPVPGDALAGCVNAYRRDLALLTWDEALVAGCAEWARHLAAKGMYRPDGSLRHSLPWLGSECIAKHQVEWAEAFVAWKNSPDHLPILRHPGARRVAMAGYSDGDAHYWVLRVAV